MGGFSRWALEVSWAVWLWSRWQLLICVLRRWLAASLINNIFRMQKNSVGCNRFASESADLGVQFGAASCSFFGPKFVIFSCRNQQIWCKFWSVSLCVFLWCSYSVPMASQCFAYLRIAMEMLYRVPILQQYMFRMGGHIKCVKIYNFWKFYIRFLYRIFRMRKTVKNWRLLPLARGHI